MKLEKRKVDVNARIVNLLADVYVENGCAKAKISFKNYYYKTIRAVKFLFKVYNSFNEEVLVDGKNEFIITVQDLSVIPSSSVHDIIVNLPNPEIRKVEIAPLQICYENDVIEEVGPPQIIEYEIECLELIYTQSKIIEREQLLYLRKQNKNAVCYPKENENGWICVCGHYNKKGADRCSSCGDKRNKIFETCTKDVVIKKCEMELEQKIEKQKREEERKKQEEERELEYKIAQEKLKRTNKKILKISLISIIVILIAFAGIKRACYVKKYGMDNKTKAQWKYALGEYEDWKHDVQHLYYGEDGFYSIIKDNEVNYSLIEIYAMSSLGKPRNNLLNKVDEIEKITEDFPEKYQEIFSKICEYQKLYYIMDIDVVTISCLSDSFWGNTYDRVKELDKEIERLEKYLYDKYLQPENVKFRDDITMSYSPQTFQYRYTNEKTYSSSTMSTGDFDNAKKIADEYCKMLMEKQSSIISISYTGNNSSSKNSATFEYKVEYVGITRIGTVYVKKKDGVFKATGMDFED